MLSGKWLLYISATRTANGTFIWLENEVHVHTVRRFERDAGKTMKGNIHFWEVDPHNGARGQFRAVDVEDIIAVNNRPTKTKK